MAFFELLLPEEKRSPFHMESIHRRLKAVLLPEDQDLKLLLGFVGEHMIPPYRPVVTGHESLKAFK